MIILLTGANGMVGKNILRLSTKAQHQFFTPSSAELNLLDSNSVNKFLQNVQPDMVIHCAGVVGGIQANIADPVKFLVDNTQMGINIIMGSLKASVPKFINLSSSCMYPKGGRNPLSEELILTGELEPTNEGYALAKITSTRLCEYISNTHSNLSYKTVIPCNLYGYYDKFDPKHSHMIPAVIKKIHEAVINKDPSIDIWGDGEARREFMFVEDLADFIIYAIDKVDEMPQNINVGLGTDYSINEYYKVIAEVIGFEGEFIHDLSKPVGMKQKLIDDGKLAEFGWRHKTPLKEGIRKTYKHFLRED